MDSFIYVCIPLFMLSGELMARTGLMDKIVDFARIFVGRLRGGVAYEMCIRDRPNTARNAIFITALWRWTRRMSSMR